MNTRDAKTALRPAELWSVWSFVKDELKERGWDEAELAERMGLTHGFMRANFALHHPLLSFMTAALGQALGGSTEFWANLDKGWWEALESGDYHLIKDDTDAAVPS